MVVFLFICRDIKKNTPNSQIYINIPREDSVISLLISYFDLNFEVIKKTDNFRYGNGNNIRLVNLAPIALFSNFKLTTSSGKHLNGFSQAHIVSLLYKLITSRKDSDDLSIGSGRSRNRRRDELAQNKNVNGKYCLRIMLKNVFGFVEGQEKATYDLGYKIVLTSKKDDAVIDKAVGNADARIKIDHIHWYAGHYIPSFQQQSLLSQQLLSKTLTELRYIERSVFMKEVNNQNLWNFELGSREGMNVPLWIVIGFQQQDRQDSQSLNFDTFCRLPVVSAQCFIGTEEYPEAGIFLISDDDYHSPGYSQTKEAFRALTKDDILQPYLSDDDFKSFNVRADDIVYNLYVSYVR